MHLRKNLLPILYWHALSSLGMCLLVLCLSACETDSNGPQSASTPTRTRTSTSTPDTRGTASHKSSSFQSQNTGDETGILWSPDGSKIAIFGSNLDTPNALEVWNAQSRALVWSTRTDRPDASFYHVSWSPDGKKITAVVSGLPSYVETWDATTGHLLWQKAYQHNKPEPVEIAWSPNGKLLAVNTGTQTAPSGWGVSIFDGGTGHLLAFNGKLSKFPNGTSIAWSPDSTTIAATSESVLLWNVSRGMTTAVSPVIAQRQDSVSWSPDGSALVFGSYGVFRVFDVATTTTRCTATYVPGDSNPMGSIAWSDNGQSIFTESVDLMMIFNASNCTIQRVSTYNKAGTPLSATVIQCSPDAKWVAFLSKEPTVRVYDVVKGIFAWHFVNPTQKTVASVSWSPNSHLLASIDVGGTIMIWELR